MLRILAPVAALGLIAAPALATKTTTHRTTGAHPMKHAKKAKAAATTTTTTAPAAH